MFSDKQERSCQDYISGQESSFLSTYLLHNIHDQLNQYLTNSEMECRLNMQSTDVDQEKLIHEKKNYIVKPSNIFFLTQQIQSSQIVEGVRKIIQKYEFNNEDQQVQKNKQLSPQARRKLFQSLQTNSFNGEIPISTINTWIPLNDLDILLAKGSIIIFIIQLKTTSNKLNSLEKVIKKEIQEATTRYSIYIQKYQAQIQPILFINGDVNYDYKKLNCPAYYISKQNLLYHFLTSQHITNKEYIDELMITNYKMLRVSQSRVKALSQLKELSDQKHENKMKILKYASIASSGSLLLMTTLFILKRKSSK